MERQIDQRRERLNRLRLYVITGEAGDIEQTRRIVAAALAGGADVIQLRKKAMPAAERLELALAIRELTRSHGALFVVNDDPALALAAGADGVHLGQEDADPRVVRQLPGADELLVGRSTHSVDQARAAVDEGADYLGVGPVFATPTKPGRPPVGHSLVREVARQIALPFVAVGGIDASNIDGVLEAGARAVAVVRAVYDAPDPLAAARELRASVEAGQGVRA